MTFVPPYSNITPVDHHHIPFLFLSPIAHIELGKPEVAASRLEGGSEQLSEALLKIDPSLLSFTPRHRLLPDRPMFRQ